MLRRSAVAMWHCLDGDIGLSQQKTQTTEVAVVPGGADRCRLDHWAAHGQTLHGPFNIMEGCG